MKNLRVWIIDTLNPARKIQVRETLNNTIITIDVMWTKDGNPMVRNRPAELSGTSFHLTKSQWDELLSLHRNINLKDAGLEEQFGPATQIAMAIDTATTREQFQNALLDFEKYIDKKCGKVGS